MENNFCKLLQHGRQVVIGNGHFYVKPCCSIPDDGIRVTETIHEDFAKKYTSVTDWTDMCKVCKQAEDQGFRSERQFHNMLYSEKGYTGTLYTMGFSTKCNAACSICSHHRSSLWAKIKLMPVNETTEDAVEKTLSLFDYSNVSEVRFSGGEPLLDDYHFKVLSKCANIEDMTIQYTTNGSIYPSEDVLELWRSAKTAFISFSVDGVGDKFEYQRWPLSWEKVKGNIERFIEEECSDDSPNNIFTCIEVTLNPLNVYYYDELEKWISQYSNKYIRVHSNLHPAVGTLSLASTSGPLRKLVEEKYGPDSPVTKLLAANVGGNFKEMDNFLRWTDRARSQNWRRVFPEIVPFFKPEA